MNLRIPIYIVSKGRPDSRLTSKALEEMGVDYSIVVEEQEFDDYAAVIDEKKIIILDKKYQRDYETFDKLRDSKSKGPGPARNFVWDHSIESGAKWHWVMDDNLRGFYRLNKNQKHKSKSCIMETKRTSSKEIIAYLAEKFPACFSTEGAAKPLKVGIFNFT